MKKFEYKYYYVNPNSITAPDDLTILNNWGENGWEVVYMNPESREFYFKREKQEQDKNLGLKPYQRAGQKKSDK
jgi:hypothetical protein